MGRYWRVDGYLATMLIAAVLLTALSGVVGVVDDPLVMSPGQSDAKDKSDHVGENPKDANKVASESWTEWAKEKVTGGLGLKQEEGKEKAAKETCADCTVDSIKQGKDKACCETAQGTGQYVVDKAKEGYENTMEKTGMKKNDNKAAGRDEEL